MTYLLKHTLIVVALATFIQSCIQQTYTSAKHFDCNESAFNITKSDTAEIIYKALFHACVEKKDIPDFELVKDKRKIYIRDLLFSSGFSTQDTTNYSIHRNLRAIPLQIDDVRFCLKPFKQLRHIADQRGAFVYVQLGHITISGDKATIGISTNWVLPASSKTMVLSGGGYILNFQKVDGEWIFLRKETEWIS